MHKALPAALGALLLVLTAGCGGDDAATTKDGKKVASSISKAIATETGNGLLDGKQADCVARKFVDDRGVAKLKSDKVVSSSLEYVANGANLTKASSAAYAEALLDCVKEKDALAAMEASMESSYGAATAGVLTNANVTCLVSKFVRAAGVKRLLATRVITDEGSFNTAGPSYDKATATDLADAIVGCVDYLKSEAAGAAQTDKTIDAGKLETCLKKNITERQLRDSIIATITETADEPSGAEVLAQKALDCQKSSKK